MLWNWTNYNYFKNYVIPLYIDEDSASNEQLHLYKMLADLNERMEIIEQKLHNQSLNRTKGKAPFAG